MPTYRSVRILLQNNTDYVLTIQGFGLMRGEWDSNSAPAQNDEVAMQSTSEWSSLSQDAGIGTAGFIRFATADGYLHLKWQQHWSGPFEFDHASTRREWHIEEEIYDEIADSIAVVVSLRNSSWCEEAAIEATAEKKTK